uniref:Uncharacterized protein n=1 Tax=Romanomermis culicivorax TaxID=13658 RepID=A0A915KIR0_ROMCU
MHPIMKISRAKFDSEKVAPWGAVPWYPAWQSITRHCAVNQALDFFKKDAGQTNVLAKNKTIQKNYCTPDDQLLMYWMGSSIGSNDLVILLAKLNKELEKR